MKQVFQCGPGWLLVALHSVICTFVLTSCAELKHSLTISTIQVAHALDIFSEYNVRQDNLRNLIDVAAVNIM